MTLRLFFNQEGCAFGHSLAICIGDGSGGLPGSDVMMHAHIGNLSSFAFERRIFAPKSNCIFVCVTIEYVWGKQRTCMYIYMYIFITWPWSWRNSSKTLPCIWFTQFDL